MLSEMVLCGTRLVTEDTSNSVGCAVVCRTTVETNPFLQGEIEAAFVSDPVELGLEGVCAEGTLVHAFSFVLYSYTQSR